MPSISIRIVVAAFLIVASTAALAQMGGGFPGGGGGRHSRGGDSSRSRSDDSTRAPSRDFDPVAVLEQELPLLRTDLGIQPEQESAWSAFVREVWETSKYNKAEALRAPHEAEEAKNLPAVESLTRLLDSARNRVDNYERLVNAMKTLYAALTPDQRTIFDHRIGEIRGRGVPAVPGGPR